MEIATVGRVGTEMVKSPANAASETSTRRLAERTASNALWNILPFFWSTCLNLVALPIIIHRVGNEDWGIFAIFAIFLAPLTLANLGFGEATIKYVAEYAARGDLETASRYVRTTFFMNLCVGVGAGVLLATVGPMLAFKFGSIAPAKHAVVTHCFYCVAVGWIGNQITGVFMGVPSAFQNFRAVARNQLFTTTVMCLLNISFVLAGWGLFGYTLATALGGLITAASWFVLSQKLFPGISLRPTLFKDAWKSSFRFGGWQTVGQVGGLLAGQSEKFIIAGLFPDTRPLGYYNTSLTIQQRVYLVVFRMSEVLFPLFSELSGESLAKKADKLMRASWLLTSLAVICLAPLISLADPLLTVYIDAESATHGALLLRMLATAGILGCATNASYYYLLGNGKTEWTATISIATGVTTVLGALYFLPVYGFRGAAAPAIVAMIVQQYFIAARMLPRVFENQLSRWRIFMSLYSPVLSVAPVVVLIWFLHPERFIHGYVMLGLMYAVTAGCCLAAIAVANRVFGGSIEHEQDLLRLFRWGMSRVTGRKAS